jgi:hypothetical protein
MRGPGDAEWWHVGEAASAARVVSHDAAHQSIVRDRLVNAAMRATIVAARANLGMSAF